MRVMVTTCPNHGHFYPMVPLLWALRSAGHEVLAAVPGRFDRIAAVAGIPAVRAGDDFVLGELGRHSGTPASQDESVDELVGHVLEYYVPAAELTVDRTVEVARAFRPDLVIHPSWEYAGPIAAAVLGVPALFHSWGLTPPPEIDGPVARALDPLHRSWGLPDGVPAPAAWVDLAPPSLRSGPRLPAGPAQPSTGPAPGGPDPEGPAPGGLASTYVPYNGSGIVPDWLLAPPERPRVLVTLGNIPIMGEHAGVLRTVLESLRGLDVEVIVAAADTLERHELPEHTRFVRNLPISQVLPSCDLAVHHGGAGSAMSATTYGVPQLVLPQMCVQYQHARRIAEAGAGIELLPRQATADAVTEALAELLAPATPYHRAVERIAAEIAERPRPAEVAERIEDLVRDTTALPQLETL